MKNFLDKNKRLINIGMIFGVGLFISFLGYNLYYAPVEGLEAKFIWLLKTYGYIILFAWSILEGEIGLIMAGLMVKVGEMDLYLAIFIAGLGGFAGDQIYFFIGRNNKEYVRKNIMHNHHEKFEKAHRMLEKYGWPVIFLQRYMYGLRTIIPISIGLTNYSAKKYAFINFISAMVWAAITIILAYIFGDELLKMITIIKNNLHIIVPIIIISFFIFFIFIRKGKNNIYLI